MANPEVQAEITRQRAILAEQADVTPEKIVAELAAIAFADLGDYVRIVKGVPVLDMSEMPPGATLALASVDLDTNVKGDVTKTRFKLHDKHAALVTLAKMFGLLQGDGVKVQVNVGNDAELESLSIEELRAGLRMFETNEHSPEPDAEWAPLAPSGAPRTGASSERSEEDGTSLRSVSDPSEG